MNEPRDTIVGDALRRLDVPDHAPDFWSRLDAELAGGDAAAADPTADPPSEDGTSEADGGAEVFELDAVGSRRGRDRRPPRLPVLAAAAAVVAIIALVVGVAVTRPGDGGESQVDMADTTPDPAPDAIEPAPETTTTTAPDAAAMQLVAEELAGEWLTLLRAGEVDAAHALLDAASQERLPIGEFRNLATGLAEGASAFAGDGVTSSVVTIDGPGGAPVWVVTFAGEVEREGMIEFASYPVVITGDGSELAVHFDTGGPTLEVDTELMTGSTLSSPLPLLVSDTAELWVSYDGAEAQPLDQSGQTSIELDVEAAAGPGTHIVTLVAIAGDQLTARAYPVLVP